MYSKKTLTLAVGVCLALCGTAGAAPDFSAQMTTLVNFNFGGSFVFAFMEPTTADLNENGVLDATEFRLLEVALDNTGLSFNAALNAAYTTNNGVINSNLDATIAIFLGANKDEFTSVLGAYMTLGGNNNWYVVNTVLSAVNRGVSYTTLTHTRTMFDESQSTTCGPCGDADGDGVKNLNEALAAANENAYATAALSSGTTASGTDTLGGCIFKFDANPFGTNRHWFFNPATGNVYFIGSDYVGNVFADQIANFIANFNVNGLTIENAHALKIEDLAENTFLTGKRASGDGWLGANDTAVEGTWRWMWDGVHFWTGVANGSAVGGAYVNWGAGVGSGEPNNSSSFPGGEDWAEFRLSSGVWNDVDADTQNAIIIEVEGDFTDSNSDGVPEQWLDQNGDGLPDGLSVGSVTITTAGGVTEVTQSKTLTLTASSEPGDQYTWTSLDTDIATVEATGSSVTLTGVSPGTVTINVEVTSVSKGLGAFGSINITVLKAEWYDLCDDDDLLMGQFNSFASLLLDEPDNELGVGDGVPDEWQVYLLTYALCKGGPGVPAEAQQAFDANLVALNGALPSATTYAGFIVGLMGQADEVEALAVKFDTTAAVCDGAFAGLGIPSLAALLHDVAEVLGEDLADLAGLPILMNPAAVGSGIAAVCTTSTEMGLSLNAALEDATDIQADYNNILTVIGGIATNLGGCPGGVAADAAAIYGGLTANGTTVPSVAWPTWTAAVDPAKMAGEPFAGTGPYGGGDYNGDGFTNAQVAAAVIAAGGDRDDFIAGATGDFGPFWTGNPAVPLGTIVLGGLMGALAVGGAVAIRRRKK